MKKYYLTLLAIAQSSFVYASSAEQIKNAHFANETQKSYLSLFTTGAEFCDKFKGIIEKENGFFISVPVDYLDFTKGTTEVFAYWAEGFYDPKLPTFLFFDGGPGGNSHGMKRITDSFNELHYDQRGIGCSRPAKLNLYRDASFYKSLNNAMDAETIRQHLGIDKITLYGVSYGTVPATIYAHLYPNHTTAVVLEGVLYSVETDEASRFINYYLKKIYKKLPEPTKEAMKIYFNSEDRATAIDSLAHLLMYKNNGIDQLENYLRYIFSDKEHINTSVADKLFDPDLGNSIFSNQEDVSAVDIINFEGINCRENRVKNSTVSRYIHTDTSNEEFKLETVLNAEDSECSDLVFLADQNMYSASAYPIQVPVTYFQGTLDGATYPKGAVWHYKRVAKGPSQLLLAKNGGHAPAIQALEGEANADDDSSPEELAELARTRARQMIVTKKALLGQMITNEDVQLLNQGSASGVQWLRVSSQQ